MAKPTSRKTKRGIFLTIILVLMVLGIINGVISLKNNATPNAHGTALTLPADTTLLIISLVGFAVALYGIWKWKRWGAYLLFIFYVLDLAFTPYAVKHALLKHPTAITSYPQWELMIFGYSRYIVEGAIWLWAIHRKWKYFE